MLEHYEKLRGLGAEVVAISFTKPQRVAAYLAGHPLPCVVAADPEFAAYRAFGLGRTSWATFLRPLVMFRYVRQMVRGWMPEKPGEGEDLLQLGGDFVLDAEQRVQFIYRSREPTDRPSADTIVKAITH